jgi:two-component system, chemotaxis family, sensor kinase Cph1
VRWGGKPPQEIQSGPLGPRLTPRGSFEEWQETVRGTAEPWDEARLDGARSLLAALHRASNVRHAETERARTQMLAILGHDLRDPLQSINMAAQVLELAEPQQTLGRRILNSSGRMQRLISQILDLSRLRGGLGLEIHAVSCDLTRLIEDLIDEAESAHPGASYEADLAPGLMLVGDPDRIAQVMSNLLGNARHHSTPGHPIRVGLTGAEGRAVLEVRNTAAPIDEATAADLFSPFKKSLTGEGRDPRSHRSHRGLGLGLYIAHEIVAGHGGRLSYRHEEPEVIFTVELPLGTDR